MSATDALLIFLDARNEIEGWLQLRGGAVAARGLGGERLPGLVDAETQEPLRVAAVVPGEAVSVHWLELPTGLAPAQAIAAARLMAADVSAQPVSELHVAIGPEVEGESARVVALVPALAMAGWLGRLQAEGLDPDLVMPEPLLLPRPDEGFVRYDRGEIPLFRGRSDAFSVEPDLATLVTGRAKVESIDTDGFEAGLSAALAAPAVNLRQGAFAKRRQWGIEWPLVRRLAMLRQDRRRNEPHRKPEAQRHEQEVVEEPQNRDDVRNEIDGAQCVGDDHSGDEPGDPGRARVPGRAEDGDEIALQGAGPEPEAFHKAVEIRWRVIGQAGPALWRLRLQGSRCSARRQRRAAARP